MACYSDKYKHTCSKVVIGVSILMGLMSLLSVIFGIIQTGNVPMSSKQKEVFAIKGLSGGAAGMGMGCIVVGVFGLMIAVLGCCTGKMKNPLCAIPYGILTFIVTIVFLVFALIGFAASSKQAQ